MQDRWHLIVELDACALDMCIKREETRAEDWVLEDPNIWRVEWERIAKKLQKEECMKQEKSLRNQ